MLEKGWAAVEKSTKALMEKRLHWLEMYTSHKGKQRDSNHVVDDDALDVSLDSECSSALGVPSLSLFFMEAERRCGDCRFIAGPDRKWHEGDVN